MRTGPGVHYPIKWVYIRKNFPLRVIEEFENWKKVCDIGEDCGWIKGTLLSNKRYVVIKEDAFGYKKQSIDSTIAMKLDKFVTMGIEKCSEDKCLLVASKRKGTMILAAKMLLTSSFVFGFALLPYFISFFKQASKDGQPIRSYGPERHIMTKKNTPTMGGIVILFSALLPILLLVQLTPKILLLIFITLSFALLGFFDDYLKLKAKSHQGLSAKTKILIQFFVAVIGMLVLKMYSTDDFTKIYVFKETIIDISYMYIPFAAFVIVGTSNAVNLTDGLDGLAATQAITSFASLGLVAYLMQEDSSVILFCIAFIGAILSFLWFNSHPARIFMGDVGSLGIGAALGL
ncbi:Phospho-N-acetylmuramoyl-pentapeptide transferase, conserved site,Phospho-N-acetylmuramoyl-, partial [Cinara cedri]